MAFTQKRINVQLTLANGAFGSGKNNQAVLTGLRVSAKILVAGGESQSTAEVAIYGLPLDMMNQLSTVGIDYNARYQNSMSIEAGDENGMHLVFAGSIANAFVDANAMPNVCLRVSGSPGLFYAMQPTKPISVKGAADAAGLMAELAGKMGFSFENAGVSVKLANPYFAGTPLTQAKAIAKHGAFDMLLDKDTMAIVPPTASRTGQTVLISPSTGMVGYPQFNQNNVIVTCLFNPEVKCFGDIQVQSDLTSANGIWKVNSYELHLESFTPKGQWFMVITGVNSSGALA